MAAVINTWPKSSHILSEMIGVWFPIANQLETAMVSESLCMPECVCVLAFALVSDYEHQTFSAMFVYFAPPRRLECVRAWVFRSLVRVYPYLFLWLYLHMYL